MSLTILFAGDLVLDEPDAAYWLSDIAPALRAADIAIGHLEVPHTHRGQELTGDVPAPGAPPENLSAIANAGFTMLSLAGNHIADCGADGIADTVALLDDLGIAHCGAGPDLASARAAGWTQCGERRVAFLSYNCVGPETGWAQPESAGCAWLRIDTNDGSPITPSAALEEVTIQAREALIADIAAIRTSADLIIVALHKGIVHTPAVLAPYERPLAQAAIDAGADVVIGHHAHIVKGIEFYAGKPIFHGLGNGCVVTRALSVDQAHPARRDWAIRRQTMFGFEPDPAYPLAPFHPEAVNAFLGRLVWHENGKIEAGILPVHIAPPGRPMVANGTRARDIADYVERITVAGGLPPIKLHHGDGMMVIS